MKTRRIAVEPALPKAAGDVTEPSTETGWNEWMSALDESMRGRLVKIVRQYGIAEMDAEDLIQATLLLAWAKREELRQPDAWLVATLKNQCVMFWRTRRARERKLEAARQEINDWSAGGRELVEVERWRRHPGDRLDLGRALRELPGRQRRAVVLRVVKGCSIREVARETGYAPASVRKVVRRGLLALRGAMNGSDGGARRERQDAGLREAIDARRRTNRPERRERVGSRRARAQQDAGVTVDVAEQADDKEGGGRSRPLGVRRPGARRAAQAAESLQDPERRQASWIEELQQHFRIFEREVHEAMDMLLAARRGPAGWTRDE